MMDIQAKLDQVNQQLTLKNCKLTRQREVIVRVLLENERDHLSAEEVFMLVKGKFPDIGLATVYRTLELLNELHIVVKMNFGDGVARYDLRDDDHVHMHHHLICADCGSLKEIKEDWLGELEHRVEQEFGFKVTDHRLDFTGTHLTCNLGDQCKKKNKVS
ncbi:MAG: transcriptional repressor [Candidatus Cohnella colombiensis]|uniref:Transcriptional repressor n=1 Tax=Candidatus Cohnella colombiensis TaxID=3121368 RepID=A0AA95EXU7_9BACL|nr:MAG: transcriptional repressor [Cohnella sp.]